MITIQINDDQLPKLASLIAGCPEMAQMVAAMMRGRKDSYTVAEAAERLRVTTKTVRNRIKSKIIPRVPGIGAIRIPAAYIDKITQFNPDA